MGNLVRVGSVSEVPEGSMKSFVVNGKTVAVAHVGAEYFAIGDQCTHDRCSLSGEGFLDGTVITCGCHGAQFDVTSGKVLGLPATIDEPSFTVQIKGNEIFLEV